MLLISKILFVWTICVLCQQTEEATSVLFVLFYSFQRWDTEKSNICVEWKRKWGMPSIFFPICNKVQAASCLTPPSPQWSLILCIAASPRCLWFQELNYSATFVDVVLQVNAAELCSSWNCSSSLATRRGTRHHRLYTTRAKEFHPLMCTDTEHTSRCSTVHVKKDYKECAALDW